MKFRYLILLLIIAFQYPSKIRAIYDPLSKINNRYGIHVFNPDEVDLAAEVVNSSGGEWGYIVVPIQSKDRDREKWNKFMDHCRNKKLIPIIRLATDPDTDTWTLPSIWDSTDFANFLNDLNWPVKNRYIIIYNEPNHGNEWGGKVDPGKYGKVALETIEIFKERNEDFFMLLAGLDAAAPNEGTIHMNWKRFLFQMNREYPQVLQKIDGWNSHSYPNPAFSSSPYDSHDHSIISYRHELDYLRILTGRKDLPIFITETGWSNEWLSDRKVREYWQIAMTQIWTDEKIVAITPFVLFAGAGPFEPFSFFYSNMKEKPFCSSYKSISKNKGEPEIMPKQSNFNLIKGVLGDKVEEIKVDKKLFDFKNFKNLFNFIKL